MNTVTISSKYQVVIPHPIREQFNLKPGQKVMFIPYNNTIHMVVVPPIEEARGIFKGIDTDPQREKVDREL
jgi:AbrB family looped-hinge helix DNA binding protein